MRPKKSRENSVFGQFCSKKVHVAAFNSAKMVSPGRFSPMKWCRRVDFRKIFFGIST
jgi:hypothetical protein